MIATDDLARSLREGGQPASLTLKVPGMANPAKRWGRTFRLTVADRRFQV